MLAILTPDKATEPLLPVLFGRPAQVLLFTGYQHLDVDIGTLGIDRFNDRLDEHSHGVIHVEILDHRLHCIVQIHHADIGIQQKGGAVPIKGDILGMLQRKEVAILTRCRINYSVLGKSQPHGFPFQCTRGLDHLPNGRAVIGLSIGLHTEIRPTNLGILYLM